MVSASTWSASAADGAGSASSRMIRHLRRLHRAMPGRLPIRWSSKASTQTSSQRSTAALLPNRSLPQLNAGTVRPNGILMITVKYDDLSAAFDFVSFGAPFEHRAFVSRDTGAVYWVSETNPIEEEEPPDDRNVGSVHRGSSQE